MTTTRLDMSVSIPDGVIFREIDGEAVVLNLETGIYFGLDPVGTRIWQMLQEPAPLSSVCDAMEREFDVERDTVERDVMDLVSQLLDKGLIEVAR